MHAHCGRTQAHFHSYSFIGSVWVDGWCVRVLSQATDLGGRGEEQRDFPDWLDRVQGFPEDECPPTAAAHVSFCLRRVSAHLNIFTWSIRGLGT